ncbi:MAG: hypothetical protein WCO26_17965 [Deltaproteobacteria bacterium]
MTVKELIELLKQFPSEAPVLIPGYEDGWDEVLRIELTNVTRNSKARWYNGTWEEASRKASDSSEAVLIHRIGKDIE